MGIAAEMVKGMSKTGRRLRGVTPFTLLAVIARLVRLPGLSRGQAMALFAEFAAAFKGQRQLYWSPGLRRELQMGRLFTDEELEALEDAKPEYEDVGEISREDWALVLAFGHEDEILVACEPGGPGLDAALAELRRRPPPRPAKRIGGEVDSMTRVIGMDSPRKGGL